MVYVTVRQTPQYHQISLDDFISGFFGEKNIVDDLAHSDSAISYDKTGTRTYKAKYVSRRMRNSVDVNELIKDLTEFNKKYDCLRQVKRQNLYSTFYIPKRSHGYRRIDAPNDELMGALRELKYIFEEKFNAMYHTSAFAYIKGRSIVDCNRKHQANESKWFCKLDLSNFFGSTTLDFVMSMMSVIYPFNLVMESVDGRRELEKSVELAFLDGGLPQGTPISPLITNIMMIPIDHKLSNSLREFDLGGEYTQRFVYTRYADDFQISSKYGFDYKKIEKHISDVLSGFKAPFKINSEKTKYGSSSGRNWMLGLMLNANNDLTVGYKNKKRFEAALSSYIMDKKNGIEWDKSDIRVLEGHRNYYRMVEGDTIDRIVRFIDNKFGVNSVSMIKRDLKCS